MDAAAVMDDCGDDACSDGLDRREGHEAQRTTSNAQRRRCPAPAPDEFEEARQALNAIFHGPAKR